MAQCLLYHGWLVLLKTGACCGLPIFFEVTTNWRAGCQKLACPVRREGRPESSSLPLSRLGQGDARSYGGVIRILAFGVLMRRRSRGSVDPTALHARHADTPT